MTRHRIQKVSVSTEFDLHYLAGAIADLDDKTVFEFIKELDGLMEDYTFTKALRDYFVKEIKSCDSVIRK